MRISTSRASIRQLGSRFAVDVRRARVCFYYFYIKSHASIWPQIKSPLKTLVNVGAMTAPPHRHVFLSGNPGVGKTTLVRKACEALRVAGLGVWGFYTEEVRQGGRRIGFDIVSLAGERGTLARLGCDGGGVPSAHREYRVGQYAVDLASFEQIALPLLRNPSDPSAGGARVLVLDEIGKMELFSQSFVQCVRRALEIPTTNVLGTIPVPKGKPLALVEEVRGRGDIKLFMVTKENRDSLLPAIVQAVQECK